MDNAAERPSRRVRYSIRTALVAVALLAVVFAIGRMLLRERGPVFEGTVSVAGKPAPGVIIEVWTTEPNWRKLAEAVTDAQGEFNIELGPIAATRPATGAAANAPMLRLTCGRDVLETPDDVSVVAEFPAVNEEHYAVHIELETEPTGSAGTLGGGPSASLP